MSNAHDRAEGGSGSAPLRIARSLQPGVVGWTELAKRKAVVLSASRSETASGVQPARRVRMVRTPTSEVILWHGRVGSPCNSLGSPWVSAWNESWTRAIVHLFRETPESLV